MERQNPVPPSQRLRDKLLRDRNARSGSIQTDPVRRAHGIANDMVDMFTFLGSYETVEGRGERGVKRAVERMVAEFGMESVAEFRGAMIGLRDQLKGELPEEEWIKYFRRSLELR